MRFSTISILSTLAALVSASTTPNYSQGPSGNPIALPGLGDQVPVGEPYQIKWEPTTNGTVSIWLLRGPSTNVKPIATIADNIDNSGEYTWTPAKTLENDVTHYGLIIIVEGTGQYQYSTQFGIKNPAVAGSSSAVVAPSSSAAVPSSAVASSSAVVSITATPSTPVEVKTTTAEETTSTATPAVSPASSIVTVPVSVPTVTPIQTTPTTPTTFVSSTSTPSSATPSAVFTGAADRKAARFGAVAAAALVAVFA